MKCPECGHRTTRGTIEKVRVLAKPEAFEMEVVVITCVRCQRTLGVVNVPLKYSYIMTELFDKLRE